ncbi:hypothetical protein FXO38_26019 [Capsicum annuum]|nr:hypothetical protein FXO38_26019 [Capsicum annuum]
MLFNKSFNTQLKKSSWVSANVTRTSLTIVSFTEKEQVLPLTFDQRIAKKAKPLATSEQEMEPTIVESESSGTTLALESLTQLRGTMVLFFDNFCILEKDGIYFWAPNRYVLNQYEARSAAVEAITLL